MPEENSNAGLVFGMNIAAKNVEHMEYPGL